MSSDGQSPRKNDCEQAIATRTPHLRMTPRRLAQSCRPSLWKVTPSHVEKEDSQAKDMSCPRLSSKTKLHLEPRLPVVVSAVPGGHAISLDRFVDDMRDWRKLRPCDVVKHFQELWASYPHVFSSPHVSLQFSPESDCIALQRRGLLTAIFVGILQAAKEGSYWAPHFHHPQAHKVEGVRVPMSRMYTISTPSQLESTRKSASTIDDTPKLSVLEEMSPLDACVDLAKNNRNLRIALLRFTPSGDVSTASPNVGVDFSEAEFFLRTTYGSALQDLYRHTHGDPVRCLESGGVVYTTDVAILRDPVEEGAAWLTNAFHVDIIWVSLPRHPDLDSYGDYGRQCQRRCVADALTRAVWQATSHGVEALVLSPPGIGSSGDDCVHPPKLIGKLLREALLSHGGQSLQEVQLCWERCRRICHQDWKACAESFQDLDRPIANCDVVFKAAALNLGDGWERNGPMSQGWMRRLNACPPPKDWRKTRIRQLESARAGRST